MRLIQVDETVQGYADERMLKRAGPEVGIAVGRSAGGKDFLLELVRCPDQDGELPITVTQGDASKKSGGGGKSKAAPTAAGGKVALDSEWIVEHAAQAFRALSGGLDILGIYVFCDEKSFQASHGVFINVLKAITQELSSFLSFAQEKASELVVLHADAVTAKLAARELSGAALKPCDLKCSAVLSNMTAVHCCFPVSLQLNLASGKQRLNLAIREAVAWEARHRINPAVALIGGRCEAETRQVAELAVSGAGNGLTVELLTPVGLPPGAVAAVGGAVQSATAGTGQYARHAKLSLSGSIDCRAYVHRRETTGAAVKAVKEDVCRTLLARLEVLEDAGEMATAVAADRYEAEKKKAENVGNLPAQPPRHPLTMKVGELLEGYGPTFPRRAFVSWRKGGCAYCDYVVEGEGASDTVHRIQELMGEEAVNAGTFCCEEAVPAAAMADARGGQREGGGARGWVSSCSPMLMGAVAVVVVGAWMSWSSLG